MGNNGNPVGAVGLWDGGTPRTLTAYAGSTISGGNFVYVSGASAVVSSGADTYLASDLVATLGASGEWFGGIALHNAASGTPVTFATEGLYICEAGGTVVASQPVECLGNNVFGPLTTGSEIVHWNKCGRALTGAGSEGYFILKLTL